MALNSYQTREQWLNFVAGELARRVFTAAGSAIPGKVRIAVAFPSSGGKGGVLGQCWDPKASADQHFEIMIRPDVDEPAEIAAILAHELVHAAVGIPAGHGPVFRKVAKAIGLQGPMRSTTAGPMFIEATAPILAEAGPIPHARLNFDGPSTRPKKQNARLIKCECGACGYIVRTARRWIEEKGAPLCPQHGPMTAELPDDDQDGED